MLDQRAGASEPRGPHSVDRADAAHLASRILASAPLRYEMLEPNAWHYVRPLDAPVLSVMLSGPPWSRALPRPGPARPLEPLAAGAADSLRESIAAALSNCAQ